jgi:hypothetical protein
MPTVVLIVEVISMLVQHVHCCRAELVIKMGIHLQCVRQDWSEENNLKEFDREEKIYPWRELSTITLNIA